VGHRDNSLLSKLTVDPESEKQFPNRQSREVKSGHYVKLLPMKLPDPQLVIGCPAMASELGLDPSEMDSKDFVRFFSGDKDVFEDTECWSTGYALSIYGDFIKNQQCPFGNGNGYGDGRAISMGEVLLI